MDPLLVEQNMRQLTLHQIKQLHPDEEVFFRLALERDATQIEHRYCGPGTVVMEIRQRKRKGPLITKITPVVPVTWGTYSEQWKEGAQWYMWSAPEGSREDGTFFEKYASIQIMQLFSPFGDGRTFAEIERTASLDSRFRAGKISEALYQRYLQRLVSPQEQEERRDTL